MAVQGRNTDVWIWKDLGVHPETAKQINPQVALTCSSILSCGRVISALVNAIGSWLEEQKEAELDWTLSLI
jgi:hypothetical protein